MSHSALSFVPATQTDVEVFESLARASIATFYDAHRIEWNSDLFRSSFSSTDNFRVERAGVIVGVLRLAREADHVYVFDLHVQTSARNQGIGTEALNFIRIAAAQSGKKSVRMRSFKSNPALKLYERHGFQVVGEEGQFVRLEHILGTPSSTTA